MDSALHALVSRIEESFSKGEFAHGIFLDIRGAFDSVSHSAISGVLRGAGGEGGVLNLILFLLCQQEVVATWNGANCCRVFNNGIPQGGVLSALVWNLIMEQLL